MANMEYILARKILKLANLIINNRNSDIKSLGLTAAQADTLVFFSDSEGKSAVDLKEHLGITHQTARGIIKRMAEKGLLHIVPSEEDGRYKKIFVTDRGKEICRRMEKNGTHTGNRLLNGMTREEKEQFLSMIALAADNLSAAAVDNLSSTAADHPGSAAADDLSSTGPDSPQRFPPA